MCLENWYVVSVMAVSLSTDMELATRANGQMFHRITTSNLDITLLLWATKNRELRTVEGSHQGCREEREGGKEGYLEGNFLCKPLHVLVAPQAPVDLGTAELLPYIHLGSTCLPSTYLQDLQCSTYNTYVCSSINTVTSQLAIPARQPRIRISPSLLRRSIEY